MATDPALFFGNEKSRNAHEWRYHNPIRENLRKDNARKLGRCAIYARVSTDQGEQDPTQQLDTCRREAERRGYKVVWEGHDMMTGDSDLWERTSGKELWGLVKAGKVDIILTYDVSRMSRQHPTSVFKMLDLLRHNSVTYVSATEPYFDLSDDNPFAEVVIFLTTFWNNYFLRKLSETTRRGKENAIRLGRKQGKHRKGCGRDFPCPSGTHDAAGRNVRTAGKLSTIAKAQSRLLTDTDRANELARLDLKRRQLEVGGLENGGSDSASASLANGGVEIGGGE